MQISAGLGPPAAQLLNNASLFLDFDGTLVDLIDRPDQVTADPPLRELLLHLHDFLDGRLAIVSGRSLGQLDRILGPVAHEISLSGSHGCEFRIDGHSSMADRPDRLSDVAAAFRPLLDRFPGTILEEKTLGVAFHFRLAERPGAAEQAALDVAAEYIGTGGLVVQEGKMMVELRVGGRDKGQAVTRLMTQRGLRMEHGTPLFVGDDLTDESAFEAAVRMDGHGVLVGPARDTAASYRLSDPAAVRLWLTEASR